MFAYPCPSCQQRLQATPERVGQRTICPKCLKPIVIPGADGASATEGRVQMPEMIGDSPSTIFVDDFAQAHDDADGMDLSLPDDAEEFTVFANDSAPIEELALLQPAPLEMPLPIAESQHVGTFTPSAMSLAAAGVVTSTATPHLGGIGAATVAADTPMPGPVTPRFATRENEVVVFQAQESLDRVSELATDLTMRMKPPPEPPSDLRISTGAWLAMTATGMSLWLLSMMRENDEPARTLLKGVLGLGLLEIVISYIWVSYIGGRRDFHRGLQALLPPVWLYRLANPCENTPGFRPLRFMVAGLLLIALSLFGSQLRPAVQSLTGQPDSHTVEIPKPLNSPLARLQDAQNGTLIRPITEALHEIATDKASFDATPEETPLLLAELRRLRKHENDEVRGAALIALKKWTGLEAVKADVLDVLRNRTAKTGERRAALDVAREYKDREITRAVARCLEYRNLLDDTDTRAAATLRAIGPPEAEDALLELFEDEDMLLRGVPSLLAEIGGAKSVEKLRKLAETSPSNDVRVEATRTADKIALRLGVKKND